MAGTYSELKECLPRRRKERQHTKSVNISPFRFKKIKTYSDASEIGEKTAGPMPPPKLYV